MRFRRTGVVLATVIALGGSIAVARQPTSPEVTVHEWGTFTSVAGPGGNAVDWLPLSGPSDLPCFVKHVNGNVIAKFAPGGNYGAQVGFEGLQSRMLAKVRMETPVIYFYSPTEFDANVSVGFTRGIITEFYPSPTQPALAMYANMLNDPSFSHSLQWNVRVTPGAQPIYPNGGGESHYYAARNTDATPLKAGVESEKFIFYRGIASFDVPIRTRLLADGSVEVWNTLPEGTMPTAILFENRGGNMGFRMTNDLARSITLAPPTLDSDASSIRSTLKKELVRAGLFEKEAQAMLDTWRDSWFEEGARVFYIMPQREADVILPLNINPAPASISRVFVGRMEVINDATVNAVKSALESNNDAALAPYARFLSPIRTQILATTTDPAIRERIDRAANAFLGTYLKQLRACE